MILGARAISTAVAPAGERHSGRAAVVRECERYGLDLQRAESAQLGQDPLSREAPARRWWDALIVAAASGIFLWLASSAKRPPIVLNVKWSAALALAMVALLVGCGRLLWRRTRFS
jgi:hypothetical protein